MQISKLYHAIVVLGASTGFAACGGEDTGTGREPVGGGGTAAGGASTSNGGSATSQGGAKQNDCAAQCHTEGSWKYCNGNCCWLGAPDPCCN